MINLTINSLNNQTIKLINQSDFSEITINNSEQISLNYSNYFLKILPSVDSYKIQNFIDILKESNNHLILLVVFMFIIACLYCSWKVVKR